MNIETKPSKDDAIIVVQTQPLANDHATNFAKK